MSMLAAYCAQGCAPMSDNKALAQGEEKARQIPVSVTPAQERVFEERITVQGNLIAKTTAMVSARIGGIVTDMYVDEGDRVIANESVLFQVDKVAVTQAYEIALQDRKVAECARRDAEAMLVAAQAQHDKAKLDYERFTRLREQQAITPDAMEQMETGYAVAKAQLERAGTAVKLYEEQEKKAAAALEIARKNLEDSRIFSPIDGWVAYRGAEQGEFVGAGTPIIKVTDTRVLEASAFLPGEYYPRVKTGETTVNITVGGVALGSFPITYKSPEIQETLRTFEIKCLVESPPEGVVPGAIADITSVLLTRTALGAPHDIVQTRDEQQVVFTVDNDRAKRVAVKTGLTTDGWTELVDSPIAPGEPLISRGYNLVNDGTPVLVQTEER